MPNELVKIVAEKTGLPEAQATVAVDAVVGYLKQHLPPPLAGHLERVMAGERDALGSVGSAISGLFRGGAEK